MEHNDPKLWNTAKAVLRAKVYTRVDISLPLGNKNIFQIKIYFLYLKEQTKPRVSKGKRNHKGQSRNK